MEDAGYECTPSDKGRLAVGQLELFGSTEDIGVVASSKVYDLLRDLSVTRGQGDGRRLFSADRPVASYSKLVNELGKQAASPVVNWLVGKGVLLRGTRIKCPRCQLNLWYEVDRLAETWRCDGCRTSLPIPVHPGAVSWSYRINELYAVGHDQGTITHLLGIFNLFPPHVLGRTSNLGYYPGVDLKAKVGASTPVESIEIDIVGIRDGKLTLVECKNSGTNLSADEAYKMADVSNHLACTRLLFMTPTEFPNAEEFFGELQSHCQARVEYWERADLFDQRASERMGGIPDGLSHEERSNQYLVRLARQWERK